MALFDQGKSNRKKIGPSYLLQDDIKIKFQILNKINLEDKNNMVKNFKYLYSELAKTYESLNEISINLTKELEISRQDAKYATERISMFNLFLSVLIQNCLIIYNIDILQKANRQRNKDARMMMKIKYQEKYLK